MSTHVGAQREGTTTNVVLVVAGVVAGFLHPIAGVLASVVLAVVAKNRTISVRPKMPLGRTARKSIRTTNDVAWLQLPPAQYAAL